MDGAEAIAEKFLQSIGYSTIAHEPDGNVPPDFSIGGEIAVEVRRLNQADWSTELPRGLESVSYPLADRVENALREFGPANNYSYWVSYTFFRPLAQWKHIYPALREALLEIAQSEPSSSVHVRPDPSIEFRFDPTTDKQDQLFNLGAFSDSASGGAVVAEMIKHIEHYHAEKSVKISAYKNRYAIWWLVLIDYIGYGLHPDDQIQLKQHLRLPTCFDKVLIVNPYSPYAGFEI